MLNFPFPTPPEPSALRTAHRCLEALSAIEPPGGGDSVSGTGGALTPLGRAMSAFQISPRHARMLLEVVAWQAQQQKQQDKGPASCSASAPEAVSTGKKRKSVVPSKGTLELALPYAVALAAALSVESPFIHVEHAVRGEGGSGGYVTQVWDTQPPTIAILFIIVPPDGAPVAAVLCALPGVPLVVVVPRGDLAVSQPPQRRQRRGQEQRQHHGATPAVHSGTQRYVSVQKG